MPTMRCRQLARATVNCRHVPGRRPGRGAARRCASIAAPDQITVEPVDVARPSRRLAAARGCGRRLHRRGPGPPSGRRDHSRDEHRRHRRPLFPQSRRAGLRCRRRPGCVIPTTPAPTAATSAFRQRAFYAQCRSLDGHDPAACPSPGAIDCGTVSRSPPHCVGRGEHAMLGTRNAVANLAVSDLDAPATSTPTRSA